MLLAAAGSSMSGAGQLVIVLLIFAGVLALCYFVTRWVAGFQKQKTAGCNLQILETVKVANNRYLHLIRVGSDRCVVIGIGKDEITTICELEADELRDGSTSSSLGKPLSASFKDLLEKVRDRDSSKGASDDKGQ